MHEQRDAVLATLPVLQRRAFLVGTETLAGQVVRQPPGTIGGFGKRPASLTAYGHHPIGDDFGDDVENRAYGPLAHGVMRLRVLTRLSRP